jgi:hypothetical protein
LTVLEFAADLIVEFDLSFSPRGWGRELKLPMEEISEAIHFQTPLAAGVPTEL